MLKLENKRECCIITTSYINSKFYKLKEITFQYALTLMSAIILLIWGVFFNCLAFCANLNVDSVSLKSSLWGLMQASSVRYEFEFSESVEDENICL